jgi:hypothetical protein
MTLFQRGRMPPSSPWAKMTGVDVFLSLGLGGLLLVAPVLAVIVLVFDPARSR